MGKRDQRMSPLRYVQASGEPNRRNARLAPLDRTSPGALFGCCARGCGCPRCKLLPAIAGGQSRLFTLLRNLVAYRACRALRAENKAPAELLLKNADRGLCGTILSEERTIVQHSKNLSKACDYTLIWINPPPFGHQDICFQHPIHSPTRGQAKAQRGNVPMCSEIGCRHPRSGGRVTRLSRRRACSKR